MSEQRDDVLGLAEVRARYADAEASLRSIKDQLDGLSSARQLEGEAATSLNGSAQALRTLASDMASLIEELRSTVTSANHLLNASTGIISSSDLAEIRAGVGELREVVKEDATQTRTVLDAKVSQFHGKLDSGVRSINERLDQLASEVTESERARKELENELAATRRRLEEAVTLLGRKASKLSTPSSSPPPETLGFS
jgi:chromosome segregation ATPase